MLVKKPMWKITANHNENKISLEVKTMKEGAKLLGISYMQLTDIAQGRVMQKFSRNEYNDIRITRLHTPVRELKKIRECQKFLSAITL